MVITVICDVLGKENNGTTIAAMNLIRALRKRGHTVRIVCSDPDKTLTPKQAQAEMRRRVFDFMDSTARAAPQIAYIRYEYKRENDAEREKTTV